MSAPKTASARLAWLGLFLALACRGGRKHDAPVAGKRVPVAEPAPRAANDVFWLRNSPLRTASGQSAGRIDAPVLVQLSTSGRVQSMPGSTPVIDGFLPTATLTTPKDGEGLALYAQRKADLYRQSPDDLVIGHAYVGALLSVAPQASVAKGRSLVALPDFRADGDKPVLASVDAAALAPTWHALGAPPSEGRLIRDFNGPASLWPYRALSDAAQPFANTLCGSVRVLAVERYLTRISQYHGGVDIEGYFEFPIDVENYCGFMRCRRRDVFRDGASLWLTGTGSTSIDRVVVSSTPASFVHFGLNAHDALRQRIERRQSVYWLAQSKRKRARCDEWTFMSSDRSEGSRLGSGTELEGRLRRAALPDEGQPYEASFGFTYQPANEKRAGILELTGPDFDSQTEPDRAPGAYKAGIEYTFVGTTTDALRMLEGRWQPDHSLVAWHADDEEHWFYSAAACQQAASTAFENPDDSGTPHGSFHLDCFAELHE